MRTTIRLDDELLARAKQFAVSSGRTLTAVIEDALREALVRKDSQPKRPRPRLPTFRAQLLPGVDLNDTAALADLMDADRDPD